MSQAIRRSTRTTARRKTKSRKSGEVVARAQFRAMKLNLAKLPTNEKFAKWMPQIRIAGVIANKTKAELIEMCETMPTDVFKAMQHDLNLTNKMLRAYADVCSAAWARLWSAALTTGLRAEKAKSRRAA